MINGKKVLALIPARGGSKGIPNKNIADLNGHPLIFYTINAARSSSYIDDIIVSTDSGQIAEVSIKSGAEVPFKRPEDLAGDTSTTLSVVIHTIRQLKELGRHYDILILLQPTSPLRTSSDIDNALITFMDGGSLPLASVSEVNDHPILMRTIEDNTLIRMIDTNSTIRRQDMPQYYRINGAIYIIRTEEITGDTSFNDSPIPYIMPKARSIDIDEPVDLYIAGSILKTTNKEM
ncbi:MAG: acylneuraminate cytidylyltransferase family protein [Lachnospiraceae bacterium]|nr:acylneuraminate cytidylyltransferase family protein [Lachnospiraceae bacterium]